MNKFKEAALSKKTGKAELITLIIYTVGIVIIGLFHEVWFDEAQAWQIARCASLKEMIFEIPHYEGHPPLWHLILAIFAKNGAPYKITLKVINTVFSSAAIAVLLYKSPFPKIIRCGLPFTYFLFYRYGVNTRPYCIMMLAFFLAASFYKERNEHPWKYILSLTLLCLSSAYGIIIAGGLCLVWTFEIVYEIVKKKTFKTIPTDKRVYALFFILIIAVFLIILIVPASDTFYAGIFEEKSFFGEVFSFDFWNKFLDIPLDSWSTRLIKSSAPNIHIASIILGLLSWGVLISIASSNKKLLTFLFPYVITLVFCSCKYMAPHHIGISTLFHIFFFWIILDANTNIKIPNYIHHLRNTIKSSIIKKSVATLMIVLSIMPFYYSIAASYLELKYYYGYGNLADFIKENHLEDSKIMITWHNEFEKSSENPNATALSNALDINTSFSELPFEHEKVKMHLTYICGLGPTITIAFDHNIIMNFNVECPDEMYVHYKYKEDTKAIMKKWREKGLPDFVLCPSLIDEVYTEEELNGVKYLPIYVETNVIINKDELTSAKSIVYMRDDLFDDYPQFHWIYDPKADLYEIKHDD